MTTIRIATRSSPLALAQALWVGEALQRAHPQIETRLVEVTTTGDVDKTSPVATLTEVGAFVRSVQRAVTDDVADIAVHSCKDLPVTGPAELVAVYPVRDAPWDVMCGSTTDQLPRGARVGTGSPRRTAQLRLLRPDLVVDDIRGNVETRLGKVDSGEYSAVVLAWAGLSRIGRIDAASQRFDLEQMVPAPSQAALAVETRRGSGMEELLAAIDHPPTRKAVEAERLVLELTGAGCRSALGCLAEIERGSIRLTGFVEDDRGPRRFATLASTSGEAVAALIAGLGLGR